MKTAFVVYCSPGGSTRHVAQVVAGVLSENAITVQRLDLGISKDPAGFVDRLKAAGRHGCLFVGSPVYRDLAVAPVMAFLDSLPAMPGISAVPFVTWGGANSGIALWQMGRVLASKGARLAGAAKVMACHSMMWLSDRPVGQGRPDADDDRQVEDLVGRVINRTAASSAGDLSLDLLDYQPESVSAEIKRKLDRPAAVIAKTVDVEKCTQCAICKQVCPVRAVVLDPLPEFGQSCFGCFSCVRECPEGAIVSAVPLEKIEAMIRERASTFDERPHTQTFF